MERQIERNEKKKKKEDRGIKKVRNG